MENAHVYRIMSYVNDDRLWYGEKLVPDKEENLSIVLFLAENCIFHFIYFGNGRYALSNIDLSLTRNFSPMAGLKYTKSSKFALFHEI